MRRTQLQLDQRTYDALRRQAFERGTSISALARDILAEWLGTQKPRKHLTIKDFPWIGAGRSDQGDLSPVSEHHDEALARILQEELAER